MMCVLLFVLHACMLRECEGARVTTMLVLGMSVVRGMRGVGGVCEMCLARDGVGGERVSG